MAVQVGKMKHRVEFFVPDGSNHSPLNTPNPRFWAEFRTLRGEPLYSARFVFNKVTAEIRMRYWQYEKADPLTGETVIYTPTAGWRVRIVKGNGTYAEYAIDSVVNVNEADEEYLITVSEVR
jgi:Phage head-tail joining protein